MYRLKMTLKWSNTKSGILRYFGPIRTRIRNDKPYANDNNSLARLKNENKQLLNKKFRKPET